MLRGMRFALHVDDDSNRSMNTVIRALDLLCVLSASVENPVIVFLQTNKAPQLRLAQLAMKPTRN